MTAIIREVDGARELKMKRQGASVFVWRDGGSSYELDSGIFFHNAIRFLETQFAAEMRSHESSLRRE